MKIAKFLLTDNEVILLADNANFIELTEAYDAAYAAIETKNSLCDLDALAALERLESPLSKEDKSLFAIKDELSRFLALAVVAERENRQGFWGQCLIKFREILARLVGLIRQRESDESKTYDYDTINSHFSTITNHNHKFELRFATKHFNDAFDAYEFLKIFELSEGNKSYDVRLAIDSYRSFLDYCG